MDTDNDTDLLEKDDDQKVDDDQQQQDDDKGKKGSDELAAAARELREATENLGKSKEKEELTEEQKAELWGVYDPKKGRPDFMRKFFRLNPEATEIEVKEAEELFADMQKGFVKQSITGAKNLLDLEAQKIRDEFGPVLSYVKERQAADRQDRFYKSFESLKDPKYAKIVNGVAKQIGDKEYDDEEEYFKDLAEKSAEVIKEVVPDFDLGRKKETKKPGEKPRLPRTSAGSTSGTRKGGSEVEAGSSDNQIDELE